MKKNIAIVGCGQWGKNLIRNFYDLGALYSVCDLDDKVAQKYASQYNIEKLSFDEIKNDVNIKGVVLTVPARLHAKMAIEAMNSGKHVFVEKPLANNIIDAKLMLETAKKNKVKLMVGHLLQYHPVFINLKKIVKSGEIGELKYICSNRMSFGRVRSEEDVMWSFAPHDISMILSLIKEEPNNVIAKSACLLQNKIADSATIHMEFQSGLKSYVSVSWLHPYKELKFVVIGKSGILVFDDTKPWNEKLLLQEYQLLSTDNSINLKKKQNKYLIVDEEEPLKRECEHFIDVVQNQILPLTDGEEGLRVLKVLSLATETLSQSKIN